MKSIKLLFFRNMLGERAMREEVMGSGAEKGRESCRQSVSESNLGDDTGLLEEGFGSEEEEHGSSLDFSTYESESESESESSRSSSHHSFQLTKSSVSPPPSPVPSSSPTSSTSPAYGSPHMMFFSLTRTADGTSLITDVHVLAKLFDGQRDLTYFGEEFDRLDGLGTNRDSSVDMVDKSAGGFLECLHADLKDFDLDRHGLVNRFSNVFHSNNTHHLYRSTFKTANLLVDESDAVERVLRPLGSALAHLT